MSVSSSSSARFRNFATVVYPESAPSNWLDIISGFFVPAFVSPLHDKDINPTGEPKKPHYHVLLMFEGKKSIEQVKALFEQIGGVGCEVVNSLRGYSRYLCHLDNPEKVQYPQDQVTAFCGADYQGNIGLPTDKYKCISEMISFCKSNGIIYYCDLLEYAESHRFDWFRVLCDSGTLVVKEYLKCLDYKALRSLPKPQACHD